MEQQFKHIKQMEHILNQMNELMETLRTTHAQWAEVQADYDALVSYYGSAQWHADNEAYDRGEIPKELPCGVLSEDAVFNLIAEQQAVAVEFVKLGAEILSK